VEKDIHESKGVRLSTNIGKLDRFLFGRLKLIFEYVWTGLGYSVYSPRCRCILRNPNQGYNQRIFKGGDQFPSLRGSSGVIGGIAYALGYGYEELWKNLEYISKSSPKLFNIQDCFIFFSNFFPLTSKFSFLINKMDILLSLLKWKQHSHPQKKS